MLITDAYRAANEHLHATTQYGTTAPRFMDAIRKVATESRAYGILDYGSGPREHVRHALWRYHPVRSYDPCVPSLSAEPEAADLLVSCDVLEHIEPELLDNVLDHMAKLALRAVFLTIATRPAKKMLPDGRNAHLIVEDADFWLPRLMKRWRVRHFQDMGGEIVVIGEARRP